MIFVSCPSRHKPYTYIQRVIQADLVKFLILLNHSSVDIFQSEYLFYRPEDYDPEADFKPTLMNTTIYLISMGMQISTFAVNYKVVLFINLPENYIFLFLTNYIKKRTF